MSLSDEEMDWIDNNHLDIRGCANFVKTKRQIQKEKRKKEKRRKDKNMDWIDNNHLDIRGCANFVIVATQRVNKGSLRYITFSFRDI